MALSGGSIETLMQLLEAKLGTVEVFDREDAREVKGLHRCREELEACRARAARRAGHPVRRNPPSRAASAAPF
ncbi:MAG: hypothetical protein OEO83_14870 [Alphaproteobacteria bacterium]|nr:hypothetical protein [Alphaproteobacteria bacterium]